MAGFPVLTESPRTLGEAAIMAGAELRGAPGLKVSGAGLDSRRLRPGEVFVALPGEHTDGHLFAQAALASGAPAALVSAAWAAAHPEAQPLLVAADPELALQRWARGHRKSFDIPVIAVAGSNGKTTTRSMLGHILASRGPALATEGNLNNQLGVPLTLLRLEGTHQAAAVEMGINHAGELRMLCGIAEPTAGVITNTGREHLEGLGSLEEAARAEFELAEFLLERGGEISLNGDDSRLAQLGRGHPVRTFGLGEGCEVRGRIVGSPGLSGIQFEVAGAGVVSLPLPGRHNVSNALAAMAAALSVGISLAESAQALSSYAGTERGRLAKVTIRGITVLDDTYNANPESLRAAVEVLRAAPCEGRRIAALGDMLELGEGAQGEHESAGEELRGLDEVWLAGAFAADFERGARRAGVKTIRNFSDSAQLGEALRAEARTLDLLLVKGSRGMKMERVLDALRRE